MGVPPPRVVIDAVTRELSAGFAMPVIWGRRDLWQVRLRWFVPPAIAVSVLMADGIGYDVATVPILLVALFILLYNVAFAATFAGRGRQAPAATRDRLHSILQAALDYAAMFLLAFFTGGPASPLPFFFVFHVIFAGILFRASTAFLFATVATVGLAALALGTYLGWLHPEPLGFQGRLFTVLDDPAHVITNLIFFAFTVFITAALTTAVMRRLRDRVHRVAEVSERLASLNDELNSLYAMVQAIGSEVRLDVVLKIITSELAAVLEVAVVEIRLLSEDRQTLRLVSAHGLRPEFTIPGAVQPAQSPWSRRVIEGETLVYGRISEAEAVELPAELANTGTQSAIFAPLELKDRVIGILGAYSRQVERFRGHDTDFFRLAANVAAIGIENARAYEAAQESMQARTRFMLQVAHNLRSPLTASAGMLDAIRTGYLGEANERQVEYLERVGRRLQHMIQTVGEILALARARDPGQRLERVMVDLRDLGEQLQRSYHERAQRKGVTLAVHAAPGLPHVPGDADLLGQLLENLASNAIKYTPSGGRVDVTFRSADGTVEIEVRDTGIGIPAAEQPKLFTEFFRASNARKLDEAGTGLGLVIVKQTAERHGGRVRVESEEGKGTTVVVELPIAEVGPATA